MHTPLPPLHCTRFSRLVFYVLLLTIYIGMFLVLHYTLLQPRGLSSCGTKQVALCVLCATHIRTLACGHTRLLLVQGTGGKDSDASGLTVATHFF